MATVFSLPNVILIYVFSYLNIIDVVLGVAYVCMHWNALSADRYLWKYLVFVVDKDLRLDYTLTLIPKVPQLRHVTLHWRTDTANILSELCHHCPNLVSIKMVCCGYLQPGCVHHLYETCVHLRQLGLGKCWAIPSQCLDDITLLNNLTTLNLSNSLLTPQQFVSISHSCTQLVSLNIDYVRGITDVVLKDFISLRTKTLEALSIFGELLSDCIFQSFEHCLKLKLLHISSCKKMTVSCLESVYKLKRLQSLTMRMCVKLSLHDLWKFYVESGTARRLSSLYISAQKSITIDDITLWSEYLLSDNNTQSWLVNQLCTCILTKQGLTLKILA